MLEHVGEAVGDPAAESRRIAVRESRRRRGVKRKLTELQQEDAARERLGASQPGASGPEGLAQQAPTLNGPSRLETVIARIRARLAANNMHA